MFRVLTSRSPDELEYNNKILETGIVIPTKCISGFGDLLGEDDSDNPPTYGSAWSLDHDFVLSEIGEEKESLHAILKKKITIECIDGKMEITDPKGCYIFDNEAEGVFIICIDDIRFDKADINHSVKCVSNIRWHEQEEELFLSVRSEKLFFEQKCNDDK
jgi:hypothetical protein